MSTPSPKPDPKKPDTSKVEETQTPVNVAAENTEAADASVETPDENGNFKGVDTPAAEAAEQKIVDEVEGEGEISAEDKKEKEVEAEAVKQEGDEKSGGGFFSKFGVRRLFRSKSKSKEPASKKDTNDEPKDTNQGDITERKSEPEVVKPVESQAEESAPTPEASTTPAEEKEKDETAEAKDEAKKGNGKRWLPLFNRKAKDKTIKEKQANPKIEIQTAQTAAANKIAGTDAAAASQEKPQQPESESTGEKKEGEEIEGKDAKEAVNAKADEKKATMWHRFLLSLKLAKKDGVEHPKEPQQAPPVQAA